MTRVRALALGALLLLPASMSAQGLPPRRGTGTGSPAWMMGWAPLDPIALGDRWTPEAPPPPRLLLAAEPRVGLLWSAGNPGALPFEVRDRWNELRAAGAFDDGAYRRPLDPNDVKVAQFSGAGWQPVGDHGAAIGRVAVDRERDGVVRFADVLEPYTGDPLVVADSSVSEMRRLRARFQGAFGWRFGSWGVGAAGGIEARDHRGDETPLPRRSRISAVGGSLGVVRRLPLAGLELGGHFRWQREAETVSVFARLRDALIYQFQGYADPARQEVKPPAQVFFRRLESRAWLWGLSAAGDLIGGSWALDVDLTRRDDGQFSDQATPNPNEDRWIADGWAISGAVQRAVLGDHLLVTASGRYTTLDGHATLADVEGVIFRGSEKAFDGVLDLRFRPAGSPWAAAAIFGLQHGSRRRTDLVAEVFSDIATWQRNLGIEVARRFGGSTRASVAYSIGVYSATASIPDPSSVGPVYRLVLAPELSFYATSANPSRLSLAVRQRTGAGSSLLLAADRESAGPYRVQQGLPFAPHGSRTLWRVSLALLLFD